MTNVSATAEKVATRRGLFAFAEDALRDKGWIVVREPRGGKSSVRLIVRESERFKVSIRTSQDAWIAFPRKTDGTGWVTLDEVDFVVAASVDDKLDPKEARVHMIPADEARAAFERAYVARKAANYTLPAGRGIWLSLYEPENDKPVTLVGAGLGLAHPPLAVRDLTREALSSEAAPARRTAEDHDGVDATVAADLPALTIPEAKRRLAFSLGVPESSVRITIEH